MHRLMSRLPVATGLAVVATCAVWAPSPAGASAAQCGVGEPVGEGAGVYLIEVTNRKGITCAAARKVAGPAHDHGGDRMLCKKKTTFRGWTIRNIGGQFLLKARFTKGSQSFVLKAQGAC